MNNIETLQQELGQRMMSLEAQRPYKDLTPANFEAYRTQYETILEIERKIEQLQRHESRVKTIAENEAIELKQLADEIKNPEAYANFDLTQE